MTPLLFASTPSVLTMCFVNIFRRKCFPFLGFRKVLDLKMLWNSVLFGSVQRWSGWWSVVNKTSFKCLSVRVNEDFTSSLLMFMLSLSSLLCVYNLQQCTVPCRSVYHNYCSVAPALTSLTGITLQTKISPLIASGSAKHYEFTKFTFTTAQSYWIISCLFPPMYINIVCIELYVCVWFVFLQKIHLPIFQINCPCMYVWICRVFLFCFKRLTGFSSVLNWGLRWAQRNGLLMLNLCTVKLKHSCEVTKTNVYLSNKCQLVFLKILN